MPDLTDQLRITDESPESIKERLLGDVNAGIDPNDPAYADTVPGSFWDDLEGCMVLELDRLYDRLNDVVAAAIPATSFGPFLDAWAVSLDLARKDAAFAGGLERFTGAEGTEVPAGIQVTTAQTSAESDPITYQVVTGGIIPVGGEIDLEVIALDAGSAGNVPANTVTILDSQLTDPGVVVMNPAAMTGGADVETDEALLSRIIRKLSGAGGAGNQDDYINWGLNYPGVGYVTVQPNTPTIGHVTVLITDINNDPMPPTAVNGLKAVLDPSSDETQGAGEAPIGATVHVATPTSLAVTVAADVTLESGYSLDGAAGTQDVSQAIEDSVARYVNGLPVGGDVARTKVIAAIVDVLGVADVDTSTLALNGSTSGNVALGATQVASLTTPITLS